MSGKTFNRRAGDPNSERSNSVRCYSRRHFPTRAWDSSHDEKAIVEAAVVAVVAPWTVRRGAIKIDADFSQTKKRLPLLQLCAESAS